MELVYNAAQVCCYCCCFNHYVLKAEECLFSFFVFEAGPIYCSGTCIYDFDCLSIIRVLIPKRCRSSEYDAILNTKAFYMILNSSYGVNQHADKLSDFFLVYFHHVL